MRAAISSQHKVLQPQNIKNVKNTWFFIWFGWARSTPSTHKHSHRNRKTDPVGNTGIIKSLISIVFLMVLVCKAKICNVCRYIVATQKFQPQNHICVHPGPVQAQSRPSRRPVQVRSRPGPGPVQSSPAQSSPSPVHVQARPTQSTSSPGPVQARSRLGPSPSWPTHGTTDACWLTSTFPVQSSPAPQNSPAGVSQNYARRNCQILETSWNRQASDRPASFPKGYQLGPNKKI